MEKAEVRPITVDTGRAWINKLIGRAPDESLVVGRIGYAETLDPTDTAACAEYLSTLRRRLGFEIEEIASPADTVDFPVPEPPSIA